MARAPFQVLIIPFRIDADKEPRYLAFKRADLEVWQWIAGGGENRESPEQAARREIFEEAGIADARLTRLDSVASIPAVHFADSHLWGKDVYVVPEYSFGAEVFGDRISLSVEHKECAWLDYETARGRLEWDSNKTALWELHSRLSASRA